MLKCIENLDISLTVFRPNTVNLKELNEFESYFSDIPNNSSFAMFISATDTNKYPAHWIYGQKLDGKIEFCDFQLNKKVDAIPPVTDYPTFPDENLTSIDSVFTENTKIQVATVSVDIIPQKIQSIIKRGRDVNNSFNLIKENKDDGIVYRQLDNSEFGRKIRRRTMENIRSDTKKSSIMSSQMHGHLDQQTRQPAFDLQAMRDAVNEVDSHKCC